MQWACVIAKQNIIKSTEKVISLYVEYFTFKYCFLLTLLVLKTIQIFLFLLQKKNQDNFFKIKCLAFLWFLLNFIFANWSMSWR